MDLNALFQTLKDSGRVKLPPGGLRIPEAFAQRAQYASTTPFVPPSPWPSMQQAKPTRGSAPSVPSGSIGTASHVTPVMEDYMRQLTQAIMTDPTGKTVADLSQRIAHEALACAGLAPPSSQVKETVRPTPVRPPPSPQRPTAPQQPTAEPRPANSPPEARTTSPMPKATEARPTNPPETREAMTSPTPPQAVIEAQANTADTIPPPPLPTVIRFARYAEAVRIACALPGPMPDPSTPTTSFWNYMAELAEHTGVRIYVRVSPLFARPVGTTKRAMIIIDAVNNAAEVLHPRGSMDDALTFLHDKDIDVEYTATTLKKYKVPEVQGVAQRYGVATHVAETGKKKVKDALIQDLLHDIEARVRACEQDLA